MGEHFTIISNHMKQGYDFSIGKHLKSAMLFKTDLLNAINKNSQRAAFNHGC